jgi:hypothetical protein
LEAPPRDWFNNVTQQAISVFVSKHSVHWPLRREFLEPDFISGLHWTAFFGLDVFIPSLIVNANNCYLDQIVPMTALSLAAACDRQVTVEALLANGADVNVSQATNLRLHQPLYDAVYKDNVFTSNILLQHGADPNLRYWNNDTSPTDLVYNLGRHDSAVALAAHIEGKNPTIAGNLQLLVKGGFADLLTTAIRQGLDVNHPCENRKMALDSARELANEEIIDILVKSGAFQNLAWPGIQTDGCPYPIYTGQATWDEYDGLKLKGYLKDSGEDRATLLEIPTSQDKAPVQSIVFEPVSSNQGWSSHPDECQEAYPRIE